MKRPSQNHHGRCSERLVHGSQRLLDGSLVASRWLLFLGNFKLPPTLSQTTPQICIFPPPKRLQITLHLGGIIYGPPVTGYCLLTCWMHGCMVAGHSWWLLDGLGWELVAKRTWAQDTLDPSLVPPHVPTPATVPQECCQGIWRLAPLYQL